MIEIRISISGVQICSLSMPVIGGALIRDVTEKGFSLLRDEAPERRGDLRRSIHQRIVGLEGEVTVGASYAVFVASGTSPHLIRPVRARALRFVVNGGVVFSTLVQHPGTKPNPFVRRAAERLAQLIPTIFERVWKQEVR
jgi:hypothetical protein